MRKRIYYFTLVLLFLTGQIVNAQVTIGSQDNPHAGAVLDLKSTTQGLLLPRVALTNVTTFGLSGTPGDAAGMVVFNTNDIIGKGIYVWDGAKWQKNGGIVTPPDDPILVNSIEIIGDASVKSGETANYTVSVLPNDAANKGVTWDLENCY